MTPEYASPEQLLGKPITTASDVYGLGVLLYELLAGKRPFRVRTGSHLELATLICEHEPDPPRTVLKSQPGFVPADLTGWRAELNSIVLKAIAKDPAGRYASAAQLSGDLSAYLNGYPLLSHPRTWRYVARKWIGRHKRGTAAAVVGFVVLIGLVGGLAVAAHRAREESLKAERESKFLVNLFQAAAPEVAKGHPVTARDLLDQGAKRIDKELASVPVVQASMLDAMARAYLGLGSYDQAKALAERSYQLRLKTAGSSQPETIETLYLVADLTRQLGDYAKAEPLFRQVASLRKKTTGEKDLAYAAALGSLGECLYLEDKDGEAESLLRKSLDLYRKLGGDYGAEVRNYLALTLERRGQYSEALSLLKEAVEIGRRGQGIESPEYAVSLHNLASAMIDQGDLNGADARLQTLAIRRKVLGNDHPMLGLTLNNLGFVLLEKGEPEAAEPFLQEVLELNTASVSARTARNWPRT